MTQLATEAAEVTEENWNLVSVASVFSVVKFNCGMQTGLRIIDCRTRLDSEPGFERADAGARCRDSAPRSFCRCGVRILERGTEFARRVVLV